MHPHYWSTSLFEIISKNIYFSLTKITLFKKKLEQLFFIHPTNQKNLTASQPLRCTDIIAVAPLFSAIVILASNLIISVRYLEKRFFFRPSSVGRTRHLSLWFSLAKIVVEDCDHGQNFNENYYVDTAQWTQINLFLARFSILYYQVYLITSQSNLTTY